MSVRIATSDAASTSAADLKVAPEAVETHYFSYELDPIGAPAKTLIRHVVVEC